MIMKLSDIKNGNLSAEWAEKATSCPNSTSSCQGQDPRRAHLGALRRRQHLPRFPAAVLNDALNSGKYDRGVIVAESFDYEIIDKLTSLR